MARASSVASRCISSGSVAALMIQCSIPDRLVPLDDSLCYSATGFHLAHDYTMDLLAALQAQGLQPEHYYPELGAGQQEMSIRHAPALRAADNHVLYRETVRGVAFRRGQAQELVARAPLLERGDELQVLELHDDRAAEHIGQRLRDGARRARHRAFDRGGSGLDVGQCDRRRRHRRAWASRTWATATVTRCAVGR